MNNEMYESRDKQICPFLLTQAEIVFLGTRVSNSIVYFQFAPFVKCQKLVNEYSSRKASLVQPKDLLDAVETYRDRVFEIKNKI